MPIATKICRVCGKEYEACHTARVKAGSFRWQDVSCSPECGAIYLARILESRGEAPVQKQEEKAAEPAAENTEPAEHEEPNPENEAEGDPSSRIHKRKKKFMK